MAIKIGGTTVINDSRQLAAVTDMDGTYTDFHPNVEIVTGTALDLSHTMLTRTLAAATTFTYLNSGTGKTTILLLDISASNHVPTFPGDFSFQATPTWSGNRYWIISIVCFSATDIQCTAVGYNTTPAAPALPSSFTINNWDHGSTMIRGGGVLCEAFAIVGFNYDSSQNRIDVSHSGGTSAAVATVYHTYIDTSGCTNITSIQAQYNVQSQACSGNCTASGYSFGPTPASDGYNGGTYYTVPSSPGALQFGWAAKTNTTGTTWTQFSLNTADPDFRIKVVCDQGTLYSTCEFTQGSGSLYAQTYAGQIP